MATMQQIHQGLTEKFGEAIAEWREPEAGDARIDVTAECLHEICRFLRDDPAMQFDYLRLVTAVDWTDHFSSVYHLYSYTHGHEVVLSVDLPRESPTVATVIDLWPAADWLERECYDMMGIVYEGHPDPGRILLPEDWEGFPLRKDYEPPWNTMEFRINK